MKVIIAGGRTFQDSTAVAQAVVDSGFTVTEVVSGAAPGVDTLGEGWAKENKILVKQFPADWSKYGRSAGPVRNEKMAEYADALIAIWDGKSKGMKNMIKNAKQRGLNVYIHRYSINDND